MNVEVVGDIPLPSEYNDIEVSVVGGFPRDLYMGYKSNDVDLVVTGVTPNEMRNRGFKHIMSADDRKPVFVDSLDREVAIARKESSTGDGHNDFNMDIVDPSLGHKDALKIDLERRDLTMNAIAINVRSKEVIDPFGGRNDMDNEIIRHVSDAFGNDPLRVVRAARYSARFGFDISDETREVMLENAPKIRSLDRDRLGGELIKSLKQADSPRSFFDVLKSVDALRYSYPNIAALDYVPAGPYEHHKEGTAYEHSMRVLSEMYNREGNNVNALLAALFHDIGKAATPSEILPSHYGHEKMGKKIAANLRSELSLEKERKGVMSVSARHHGNLGNIDNLNATTLIDIAKSVRGSPLNPSIIGKLAESDGAGRIPQININGYDIERKIMTAIHVIEDIGGSESLQRRGYTPEDIGKEEGIPGERVGDMIRQDRAEELRERLSRL